MRFRSNAGPENAFKVVEVGAFVAELEFDEASLRPKIWSVSIRADREIKNSGETALSKPPPPPSSSEMVELLESSDGGLNI